MLRINDGQEGRAEAPMVKSRAFYLKTGEAQAAPNIVVVMYPYHVFSFIHYIFICFILSWIGMFLVNGMSTHVLFDLGATLSFVSLALCKKSGGLRSRQRFRL